MDKLLYPNLRNGLVGAWCPSIDRSRSTLLIDQSSYGNHGTLTNMDPATDWVASDGKVALDFDGSNNSCVIPKSTNFGNSLSVAFWFRLLSTPANYATVFSKGFNGSFIPYFFDFRHNLQGVGTTDRFMVFARYNGSTTLGSIGTVNFLTSSNQNIWWHAVGTFDSTGSKLYLNGVLNASNANADALPTTTRNHHFSCMDLNGTLSRFSPVQLDDMRAYDRALTPSEISILAQRRGIAYETYRVPIVRGASGGGTTVTPTTAALVLTTFEPTVSITTTVVPTTTALVLTTFAPVVTTPQAITPTTAALTLTPFAATVSTPTLITPPEIDLTLTGYSPDIFTPILVTPTIVGLITTTFEPTITISADKIVIPTTLDLTLTTFAPNVALGGNQTATPTTVTLSLTTFSPTVTTSNAVEVVPDTNALTITTYAPTVSAPVTVTPGVLALTLTSYSATIVNPVTVTPTTRSLTLTTYAPNLGEEVVSNFNYYYMMIQGV